MQRTISKKNRLQIANIILVTYTPWIDSQSDSLQVANIIRQREDPAAFENAGYILAQYPLRRLPFWPRPVVTVLGLRGGI